MMNSNYRQSVMQYTPLQEKFMLSTGNQHTEDQHILIVDDASEAALCFTRALERFGFNVRYVTNGVDAVAVHREAQNQGRPFTLLILDWAMPIVTGWEVAQTVRNTGDEVKIVFLTAYYDDIEASKVEEVGAEIWGKPIDVRALSDNVRRVLNIA